jgi:putative transposase
MPLDDPGVPPINIPEKQLVLWDGRLMTYRGRSGGRRQFHVFVDEEDVPVTMTDRTFVDEQVSGRLRLVTAAELERAERGLPRLTLELATPDDLKEVERKLRYVRAWDRDGRPPRTEERVGALLDHVARQFGDPERPSARTFARWVSDWLLVGEKPEGLLPERGGNSKDRLDAAAREMLSVTVEREYLVDTRPTATAVWRQVGAAFEDHNAPLPEEDRLPVPTLKTVLAEIAKIDKFTLDFCREGPRAAAQRYRPKGSGPVVELHNDTWECDHTTVDVIIVDPVSGLPIGRPTVTVMLDRATRMVMGVRIGFEPPSAESVLECLRVSALPKHELLASAPDLDPSWTWPCMGLPRVLVTDQAKEFKSKALDDACLSLGVDLQHAPALKAWYKGRIERFFRTLAREVFHRVPGTTFANFFERHREAVPEKVAVTTLAELWAHTIHFLVGIYARRPHRALGGRSSLDLWSESVARHGVRPIPSADELRSMTSHVTWRKPQPYGIEYEGLIYNGPEVAMLRVRPGRPQPVKIRVDRDDLTSIRFIHPETGAPVPVPIVQAMRPIVAGVSLHKHKLARALQRQNAVKLAGSEGLKRAYRILDAAMSQKLRADGLKNRMQAARYWEKLTRPPEPEDAPAFDPVRSSRSLVEEVLETDAPAVAELDDEEDDGEAQDDGAAGQGAPAPAEPAEAAPAVAAGAPEGPKRPARGRRPRKPGQPGAAPPGADIVDEDLDELVRGLGLTVSSSRKEEG